MNLGAGASCARSAGKSDRPPALTSASKYAQWRSDISGRSTTREGSSLFCSRPTRSDCSLTCCPCRGLVSCVESDGGRLRALGEWTDSSMVDGVKV